MHITSIYKQDKTSIKKHNYNHTNVTREVVKNEHISDTFIEYIKSVENNNKTGFDVRSKRWMPHRSIEGGSDTIAYGHKIQKNESYLMLGITDEEAVTLLKTDINKARNKAKMEVDNKYGTGTFDALEIKYQEMLIDFAFNLGGLRKFPNLTNGIISNNHHVIRTEYKLYNAGKELVGRNKAFHLRFIQQKTLTNSNGESFYGL